MIEIPLSQREAEQLAQYYRDNYDRLYRYALHILHDSNCAEVAVQETFLIASRRIDKLLKSEKPVGWLYNTLKYVIKSIERDRAEIMRYCISLEDTVASTNELQEPNELDESLPNLALLKRFYVEGYKLSELAEDLHTTVPAIKMQIYRAKKRLRDHPKIKKLRNLQD